jgi:hypothetical protein
MPGLNVLHGGGPGSGPVATATSSKILPRQDGDIASGDPDRKYRRAYALITSARTNTSVIFLRLQNDGAAEVNTGIVLYPGDAYEISLFAVYHLLIDQPAAPKLTKITVDMVSDGAAPVHSVPSDVGDIQNIETISVLDAGAVRLRITNNEANSITVSGKVIE